MAHRFLRPTAFAAGALIVLAAGCLDDRLGTQPEPPQPSLSPQVTEEEELYGDIYVNGASAPLLQSRSGNTRARPCHGGRCSISRVQIRITPQPGLPRVVYSAGISDQFGMTSIP